MYEFQSRVRYSEVDENGNLKLSALVNYLQDSSTFHSEDLGIGVEYLKERHIAWVLNYWQIDIISMPRLADHITIGTIPYEIKGFIGLRNFYITDDFTGDTLVKANSVWTLIDLEKLRPVKADEKMLSGYGKGEKIDMEYTDRKILLEGEPEYMEPIVINRYMLDTNGHVNNEKYIEMSLTFLPGDFLVKRIRTEYKQSAYLNDVLIPAVYESEQGITVAFMKEGEKEPSVKCQFQREIKIV